QLRNSDPNDFDLNASFNSLDTTLAAFTWHKRLRTVHDLFLGRGWMSNLLLIVAIYVIWIAILYFVLLRTVPITLVGWNQFLDRLGTVNIPGLGPLAVKLNYLLLAGLHQHTRVLAAWIEENAETARINFLSRYRSLRGIYYPLPVNINESTVSELTSSILREYCSRNKFLLRILGEGGVGKTTLACQIGLWAIEKEPAKRLF